MWPEGKKKRRVEELAATSTLSGGKQRQSETEVRRFTAAAEEILVAGWAEARGCSSKRAMLARP